MISLSRTRSVELALEDLSTGTRGWRLWTTLGWNDIKQRYRRSIIGPFWLSASMGVMVAALGIVYARIFNIDPSGFIPFLCAGLLVWNLLTSVLSDAGTLFIGSESYIKQVRLPFMIYVYRFMWSRMIIFAHNFVVYLGVIAYLRIFPGPVALIAILGLAVVLLNGLFVGLYIGMISARFRDTPQIIASSVQIIFFVTPIMWKPEFLANSSWLVTLNPFFHLIEIIRSPLLGQAATKTDWIAAGIVTLLNATIAGAMFAKFRARIPYWV